MSREFQGIGPVESALLEELENTGSSSSNDFAPHSPVGQLALMRAIEDGSALMVERLLKIPTISSDERVLGLTPLYVAAREGRFDIVSLLIEAGADPNTSVVRGETPLMPASYNGHISIVRLLLQHKAIVNRKSEDGFTPLLCAVDANHLSIARMLLEAGANPNAKLPDGSTPLLRAILGTRNPEMVLLLLEHGANVNTRRNDIAPLSAATDFGDEEIIRLLLRFGADPCRGWKRTILSADRAAKDPTRSTWEYFNQVACPLLYAVIKCGVDIVKLMLENSSPGEDLLGDCLSSGAALGRFENMQILVDAGADINYEDGMGRTALTVVSGQDMVDRLLWLLGHGADPNQGARDDNLTPLMRAAGSPTDDPTSAVVLMERGADPNATDEDGWTALDWALEFGNSRITDALRMHGAKTGAELTPEPVTTATTQSVPTVIPTVSISDVISCAMECEDVVAVGTALANDADPNALNKKSLTSLTEAVRKGKAQLVKTILDNKPDTEVRMPKVGMTPLMMAAREGHASIASLLIHAGADINATDLNGNSVLRHAMEGDNVKIIEMLISRGADPECKNNKGVSPREWVIKNRKTEALQLIDGRKQ